MECTWWKSSCFVKTDCFLILINSIRLNTLTVTASLGSVMFVITILILIINMIIMFITESAAVHNYVCSGLQEG